MNRGSIIEDRLNRSIVPLRWFLLMAVASKAIGPFFPAAVQSSDLCRFVFQLLGSVLPNFRPPPNSKGLTRSKLGFVFRFNGGPPLSLRFPSDSLVTGNRRVSGQVDPISHITTTIQYMSAVCQRESDALAKRRAAALQKLR